MKLKTVFRTWSLALFFSSAMVCLEILRVFLIVDRGVEWWKLNFLIRIVEPALYIPDQIIQLFGINSFIYYHSHLQGFGGPYTAAALTALAGSAFYTPVFLLFLGVLRHLRKPRGGSVATAV